MRRLIREVRGDFNHTGPNGLTLPGVGLQGTQIAAFEYVGGTEFFRVSRTEFARQKAILDGYSIAIPGKYIHSIATAIDEQENRVPVSGSCLSESETSP
jgi:hypothetical protein